MAHWSVLLGAFFASGSRFDPPAWIGFIVIVLVHELGHAFIAQRFGMQVSRIEMHGLGGVCHYSGYPTGQQRSIIAWGGVLGQLALLILTIVAAKVGLWPSGESGDSLYYVFTDFNAFIMAINLLPIGFLDGATALKIFRYFKRPSHWRWPRRRKKRRHSGTGEDNVVYLKDVNKELRDRIESIVDETMESEKRKRRESKSSKPDEDS